MVDRISRRAALRGVGIAAAVAAGSAALPASAAFTKAEADGVFGPFSPLLIHSPPLQPFRDDLPRLPVLTGTDISLDARSGVHQFHADLPKGASFGYGGVDYLGPTIETQSGVAWTLRYRNQTTFNPLAADIDTSLHELSESDRTATPTTLHLHGGVTPPDSDGHSEQISLPGQGLVHHFPNNNPATQLWYHDHAMSMTRINVYAGLAGVNLVRDRFDTGLATNPLGLPAGDYEMPMILQEKIMKPDGNMSIRTNITVPQGKWEGGGSGDVGVVNGKVWPRMDVARGLYRLRILNAGSYSVWNLFFSNKMPFWVIGNDGGLLDAPVSTTSVKLAPAERADILVDFNAVDAGTLLELRNDEPPNAGSAGLGAVTMPLFCQFRVGSSRGFTGAVPQTLRGGRNQSPKLPAITAPQSVRTVSVVMPSSGLSLQPAMMTLNNLRYTDPDIETPRQGAVEQWDIVNTTPEVHPIHLHLVHFRILGRQTFDLTSYQRDNPRPDVGIKWAVPVEKYLTGPMNPASPWEAGAKDTVNTLPGTVTRILVRFPTADELGFDPDAVFPSATMNMPGDVVAAPMHDMAGMAAMPGMPMTAPAQLQGYMWHCHMLDHEDHEMMLRYRVLAT